jgi:hypothetical protein
VISSEISRNEYWSTSTIILGELAASTFGTTNTYIHQPTHCHNPEEDWNLQTTLALRKLIKEILSLVFWTKR